MRGLPFSASKEDILQFLCEIHIVNGRDGIFLVKTGEGKPTGDAFVLLASEDDAVQALGARPEGYWYNPDRRHPKTPTTDPIASSSSQRSDPGFRIELRISVGGVKPRVILFEMKIRNGALVQSA